MTDLQALLKQIVLNPKEDSLRLMYADELDDIGESDRAEFIRVQCELAKHPLTPTYQASDTAIKKNELLFQFEDRSRLHHLIGSRINLDVIDASGKKRKHYDNLLLTDWGPDGDATAIIDEHSIPEPDRIKELRQREQDLIMNSSWWANSTGNKTIFGIECIEDLSIREFDTSRGFISSITCDGEDFLKHADKLIWNEGMTDKCKKCDGEGEIVTSHRSDCYYCKGRGSIPRPMPDTAQPIEKVELTTLPRSMIKHLQINMLIESLGKDKPRWGSDKYKGIEFELPDVGQQLATY